MPIRTSCALLVSAVNARLSRRGSALLVGAKQGSSVLFCMPSRTNCVLLVPSPVSGPVPHALREGGFVPGPSCLCGTGYPRRNGTHVSPRHLSPRGVPTRHLFSSSISQSSPNDPMTNALPLHHAGLCSRGQRCCWGTSPDILAPTLRTAAARSWRGAECLAWPAARRCRALRPTMAARAPVASSATASSLACARR
jgi:hypothetical protein